MKGAYSVLGILCIILIIGCDYGGEESATPQGTESVNSAEKWNSINNPSVFSPTLEYKLSALPKEGKAEQTPWPDTYWPTYEDSINARWQVIYHYKPVSKDTLSPAEKYDMAFNNWNPGDDFYKLQPYSESNCESKKWDKEYYEKLGPLAKWVSKYKGNWEAHNGVDDDGDGKTDECDDRDGVETWWGLCHAWVPAAILEKEPKKPVVYNGVKFEISDIKALLIIAYDSSNAKLIGGRCNDKEVKTDPKTGRILADQCRDVNAGTFHVVMANYLGKMKKAIAEDKTYDYEVWNQPILGWKVDSMKKITKSTAIKLLKLEGTSYQYNADAKSFYEVYSTVYYVTESYPGYEPLVPKIDQYTRTDKYHYILELDGSGKIIGGEWLDQSLKNHPDFLWLPISAGTYAPISMANVQKLLQMSLDEGPVVPPSDMMVYENKTSYTIPDNNAQGVTSTINVPDDFQVGSKVEVEVVIEHTYIGDLIISLKHGTKTVVLQKNQGGSAANLNKTFTVTDFTGDSAKGEWGLVVVDNAAQDTGKIVSWKLKIAKGGGATPGGTIKASATDCPKNIPDNSPTGVTSTINITESKVIKGVKVTVKIEHTYIGALVVKVKHGEKEKILHNQEGGGATSIDKSFDVSEFNGMDSKGTWELNVADMDAYNDTGKIVSWSIEIAY